MHIIYKKQLENLINSFSGDYRELYLEMSEKSGLRLLNGKIEPIIFIKEDGFNILSRTGNKKYFKASDKLDLLEDEVLSFKKTYFLDKDNKKIKLNGKEKLTFKKYPISKDIKKFSSNILFLDKILSKNKFIKSYDIHINLSYKSYIVGNSNGNFDTDSQYYNTFFVTLIGEKDGNTEEIYEKITGINIIDLMGKNALEECLQKAIKKLEEILDGTPSPSGMMDILIANEAGGTIIHEAVGHGLEADMLNSSIYKGKLGKKVAKDFVNIIDDPTRGSLRGYYKVDHEGTKTKKTYLIKNGVLVSYMHNNKTAEIFNTKSTGHARRENYKYDTLVRMGTTYLDKGKDKIIDMIKKIKNGIYVYAMGGGQVNTVTGDFIFNITHGRLIKNGKIGKIIRGGNISGNGPELLNNILGISDDLNFFDGGTCGKGQSMPVSDGMPTILVRLKVTGKN